MLCRLNKARYAKPLLSLHKRPGYNFTPIPIEQVVIGANCAMHLLYTTKLINNNLFEKHFYLNKHNIEQKRYYTLYTSTFAHANLIHLAANCFTLNFVSGPLARRFGDTMFIELHIIGGILGGLSSYYYDGRFTSRSTVGASSSICAHFSFLVCALPHISFYMFPIPFPTYLQEP